VSLSYKFTVSTLKLRTVPIHTARGIKRAQAELRRRRAIQRLCERLGWTSKKGDT
jgi:hypothetical protein